MQQALLPQPCLNDINKRLAVPRHLQLSAVLQTTLPAHASQASVPRRHHASRIAAAMQSLDIRTYSPASQEQDQQTAVSSGDIACNIPPVSGWGRDEFLMAGCEPHLAPLRVAVLVSGGVDSSLALQLVAAAGHKPTAFYLQIWFQEDYRNFWDTCPWEEDLKYARKVCDSLDVPLVVLPLTHQYWDRVVSHSVADIKAGRTPNPDILCNSRVKFGAFYEYLEQEHAGSFDRIASGHYACLHSPNDLSTPAAPAAVVGPLHADHTTVAVGTAMQDSLDMTLAQLTERQSAHADASSSSSSSSSLPIHVNVSSSSSSSSRYSSDAGSSNDTQPLLCLTPDTVKDQTYFLANLSPMQLSRCMFPLGGFTKQQVRALAAAAGLATSGRRDSQGICFLGKVKFGEFVKEHLGDWPGPLVEADTGEVVGIHDGYWFYTVGQRGGIKLPGGPWYVTAKDMTHNVVYVTRSYYEQDKRRDAFVCGPFNWLSSLRPVSDQPLLVKVRHGPNMYECQLQLGSKQCMMAQLQQGLPGVAAQAGNSYASQHVQQQPPQQQAGKLRTQQAHTAAANGYCSDVDPQQQRWRQQQQQQADQLTDHLHPTSKVCWFSNLYGLVQLPENDQGLAAGQYAVFYQQGVCLGSAQLVCSVLR